MNDPVEAAAQRLDEDDLDGIPQGVANEALEELEQQGVLVPVPEQQRLLVPAQQGARVLQSNELPPTVNEALAEARAGAATLIHLHADALLRHRHLLTPSPIETRGVLNRVNFTETDLFFVEERAPGGKRPRDDDMPSNATVIENQRGSLKVQLCSAGGGSLKHLKQQNIPAYESFDHPLEGILKRTASLDKASREALAAQGKTLSVAQYTIVLLPQKSGGIEHPSWRINVPSGSASGERSRPPIENVHFQFKDEPGRRVHLIHSILRSTAREGGGSSGAIQVSSDDDWDEKTKLSVTELRVAGVEFKDFVAEVEKLKEAVSDLQKRLATVEDQQSSGTSTSSAPHAFHAADFAEWLELRDHSEMVESGMVVEALDGRISKQITGTPGSVLFVVSTEPAVKCNMQPEPEREACGRYVVFTGQAPVRIVADSICSSNAFLIPSGQHDGCARPVTAEELRLQPELKEQIVGVAWGSSMAESIAPNAPDQIHAIIKPAFITGGLHEKQENSTEARVEQFVVKVKQWLGIDTARVHLDLHPYQGISLIPLVPM